MWRQTTARMADARGMTLIEISITLAIVAILLLVAIPSVSNVTQADLRSSARKVAGTIRYTYDLAVRRNATFRVVFDLEKRAWWVESASDKFQLNREKTDVVDGALDESDDEPRQRRFTTRGFIESGQMWKPKQKASFASFSGPLTPKVSLPDSVAFSGVWVAHQTDRVTAGRAYLYCFPTGMTQRAVIHLVDEDENVYTLWVHPLVGRVEIFSEYVEAPDE